MDSKRTAILEMLVDHPKGITARDVQRGLHLATAEEARLLLEGMTSEGVLEGEDLATGGRPQRLYCKARK